MIKKDLAREHQEKQELVDELVVLAWKLSENDLIRLVFCANALIGNFSDQKIRDIAVHLLGLIGIRGKMGLVDKDERDDRRKS